MCDLGGDLQRGEPWGEQGPARGVPPLLDPVQCSSRADAEAAGRAGGLFQLQSAPRLNDRVLRAALFAARTNSTAAGETVNGRTVA